MAVKIFERGLEYRMYEHIHTLACFSAFQVGRDGTGRDSGVAAKIFERSLS